MPRRKRGQRRYPGRGTNRDDSEEPIIISEKDQKAFDSVLSQRAPRWAEEYSESRLAWSAAKR